MNRLRARPGAVILLLLGAGLVLRPVALLAQTAGDEAPAFTGFNISADSSGISATFGDPKGAPYPTAAGIVPQSVAALGTGPTGQALASVIWPGPLVANAGSLAGLVLPVCVPDGSGVCTPHAPPEATLANYPIRAQASSNGPTEATFAPGMSAKALGDLSEARAELQNASSPGAYAVATVATHARGALEKGVAVGSTESHITGIDVGNGAVTIDAVTTLATASNDGKNPVASGSAIVQGLKVGGQPVRVDESGVHVGDSNNDNPAGAAVDGVNEGMKQAGMEIYMLRPVKTREGDTITYRSGSLVIDFDLGDSGNKIILAIGGSTVQAQATPALALPDVGAALPSPGDSGLGSGDVGAAVPAGSDIGGGVGGDTPSLGAAPSLGGVSGGSTGAGLSSSGAALPANAKFDTEVPMEWIVIALLGAVLFGVGLRRLSTNVLERAPAPCLVEGRTR